MTYPTIVVTISSLDKGTVPSVTESITVKPGGAFDVNVTWPEAKNEITCTLQFIDGTEDPINDNVDGTTEFQMTRKNAKHSATNTLGINRNASTGTDIYTLTLTVNGNKYSSDPRIIVDDD